MKFAIQYKRLLPLALLSVLAGGCVKSIDGLVEDPSQNRPFPPGSFGVKTAKDTATFSWAAPVLSQGKKYTYTVDIAQDSAFSNIELSRTVDTLGFYLVDPTLTVGRKYYARLHVNPFKGSDSSRYIYLGKPFSISGQNYLRVLRDFELTPTSALIHWYANTAGLNKIVLSADGSPVASYEVSAADNSAGWKLLNNLAPDTRYSLQLFADTKSKGIMTFTTPKALQFTTTLQAGGDLAGAINAAADGAVIGLNPGTYTLGTSVFNLTGKSITIASTSNNPADTKINVRELDLVGSGAGITLQGVEINGNYTGTSYGVQFLNLKGAPNQGDPANFGDIRIDNCIIHDFTRCFLIGNNASAATTHTIKSFVINNSVIYNIDKAGTSTYYTFSLEKNLFGNFTISKSTFYSMGAGMFNVSTLLTGSTVAPTITIDYCTFNNFGGSNKYVLFDANTNKISYTIRNSILANTPITGSINGTAFRCTGVGSTLDFLNNDYFNFNASATATTPVVLTGLNQVSSLNVNLGWTAATTNFSLAALPADHPVLSASTSGSAIGDPRWVY